MPSVVSSSEKPVQGCLGRVGKMGAKDENATALPEERRPELVSLIYLLSAQYSVLSAQDKIAIVMLTVC
jgi:hypothetical protein